MLQQIFRPPLDDYDVLIELDRNQLPRHYQAVDSSVLIKQAKPKTAKQNAMPVVQFDPVQQYLAELKVIEISAFYLKLFTHIFTFSCILISLCLLNFI